MMRCLAAFWLTLLVASNSHSQSSFLVEGKSVKTGQMVKNYIFYYKTKDSISVFFSDSIVSYTNSTNTILKETTYSKFDKEPSVRIEYRRTDKEDSICKLFSGDKLAMVYETRFDSLDRMTYHAMKRYWPDNGEDDGFEWTYGYRDSLVNSGKFTILTRSVDDAYGGKRIDFTITTEYDRKNRKLKQISNNKDDSVVRITTYIYDNKDRLIGERTGDHEDTIWYADYKIRPSCDVSIERAFSISQFREFIPLIKQLITDNIETLNSNTCADFICTYFSPDKQLKIILRKVQPYWEGGRNVSVIVTYTQQ